MCAAVARGARNMTYASVTRLFCKSCGFLYGRKQIFFAPVDEPTAEPLLPLDI